MPDPGPFERAFAKNGITSDYQTGPRDAVDIGHLGNIPPGKKGDEYIRLMQMLTGPKREAGPEARRAEALMPPGPQASPDEAQMQPQSSLDQLLAFLTKPRVSIGMAGGK